VKGRTSRCEKNVEREYWSKNVSSIPDSDVRQRGRRAIDLDNVGQSKALVTLNALQCLAQCYWRLGVSKQWGEETMHSTVCRSERSK
jgi:hypothetical protein